MILNGLMEHIHVLKIIYRSDYLMKTVIYARKSRGTEEELNSQVSICKDYCNKNGYVVSEIFAEIRSSQDFEREQYIALKNYIKENTKVRIIVTHADRLNRNLIHKYICLFLQNQ